MREVGAYEAKTHLPSLLRAVEAGETVVITRRGVPIARIVPTGAEAEADVREAIHRLKAARRQRPSVPVQEIIEARHEGHQR
jgi:prevent-host-death family protein